MELLKFIFSDIWHFLGVTTLIVVIGDAIVEIIKSFKK